MSSELSTSDKTTRITQRREEIRRFKKGGAGQKGLDEEINEFKVYEFLCRQQEAKEWIEEVTGEPCSQPIFLDNLRNGAALCKCAQKFDPAYNHKIVITEEEVLKFQETENIRAYLDSCTRVGLPSTYLFSIPDLWDQGHENVVNIVHCIHSLSRHLESKGINIARMKNLMGKVSFSAEEMSDAERKLREIEQRKSKIGGLFASGDGTKIRVYKNGDMKKCGEYNLPEDPPGWGDFLRALGWKIGGLTVTRLFDSKGKELKTIEDVKKSEDRTVFASDGADWIDPNARDVTLFPNGKGKGGKPYTLKPKAWEDLQKEIVQAMGLNIPHTKIRVFEADGYEIQDIEEITDEPGVALYISTGDDFINPNWRGIRVKKNGDKNQKEIHIMLPDRSMGDIKQRITKKIEKRDAETAQLAQLGRTKSVITEDVLSQIDFNKNVTVQRLFNYKGDEIINKDDIPDKGLVYASYGEDWIDPNSKPVVLYKNGSAENPIVSRINPPKEKDGDTILDEKKQWHEVLQSIGAKLGTANVKRVFNDSGKEVFHFADLSENGVYYGTQGEDWIDPSSRAVVLFRNGECEDGVSARVPINVFENTLKASTQKLRSPQPYTRLFNGHGKEITAANFKTEIVTDMEMYASTGEDWLDPKWRTVNLCRNGDKGQFVEDVHLPKRPLKQLKTIISKKLEMLSDNVKLYDEFGEEITDPEQIEQGGLIFVADSAEEFDDPFAPHVHVYKNGQKGEGIACVLKNKKWGNVLKAVAKALGMDACAKLYTENGKLIGDRDDIADDMPLYACATVEEEFKDPFAVVTEVVKEVAPKNEPTPNTTMLDWNDDQLSGLTDYQLQMIIRNDKDDEENLMNEIQRFKSEIVKSIRQNNLLDKDIKKMDKKIELLIKNRITLEEVMAERRGLFRFLFRKKETGPSNVKKPHTEFKRKLNNYANMFYLLQTDAKYLAKTMFLVPLQKVEEFLETAILSLYGFAFSPREEYLLLNLISVAIKNEVQNTHTLKQFLQENPVVAKLFLTYGRRNQGKQYLTDVLLPVIKPILDDNDLNLEINAVKIYKDIINAEEMKSGIKQSKGEVTEQAALENPDVKKLLNERVKRIEHLCSTILDGLYNNIDKLPYGFRWVSKRLRVILKEKFKDATDEQISTVIGYFVFFRFMNPALVAPDSFGLAQIVMPGIRRNLVIVSKVLQNLANNTLFLSTVEPAMVVMNDFIQNHMERIQSFFLKLTEVADPEEHLGVNQYLEWTQRTAPQISISINEIYKTHRVLQEYMDDIAKEQNDPLRKILLALGPAPDGGDEDAEEEINLTLQSNLIDIKVKEETELSLDQVRRLTLVLVRRVLRNVPQEAIDETFYLSTENTSDYFKTGEIKKQDFRPKQQAGNDNNSSNSELDQQKKEELQKNFENLVTYLKQLEHNRFITVEDGFRSLLLEVFKDARSRIETRIQQKREITRCQQTLQELSKNREYLTNQVSSYTNYLENAKKEQVGRTGKKKKQGKIGPFSFSYAQLKSKGVITALELPSMAKGAINFVITSQEPGIFDIEAKVMGKTAKTITIALDDLLERQYNGDTEVEYDMVKLNINMTIHTLNKLSAK